MGDVYSKEKRTGTDMRFRDLEEKKKKNWRKTRGKCRN